MKNKWALLIALGLVLVIGISEYFLLKSYFQDKYKPIPPEISDAVLDTLKAQNIRLEERIKATELRLTDIQKIRIQKQNAYDSVKYFTIPSDVLNQFNKVINTPVE